MTPFGSSVTVDAIIPNETTEISTWMDALVNWWQHGDHLSRDTQTTFEFGKKEHVSG